MHFGIVSFKQNPRLDLRRPLKGHGLRLPPSAGRGSQTDWCQNRVRLQAEHAEEAPPASNHTWLHLSPHLLNISTRWRCFVMQRPGRGRWGRYGSFSTPTSCFNTGFLLSRVGLQPGVGLEKSTWGDSTWICRVAFPLGLSSFTITFLSSSQPSKFNHVDPLAKVFFHSRRSLFTVFTAAFVWFKAAFI